VRCSHIHLSAVISPSSVGRMPWRLLFCIWLDHHHRTHRQRHMDTGSLCGGSTCQRVRCSHRFAIAVSRNRSVGRLPSMLLLYTWLWTTTTAHNSQRHMDTSISSEKERLSTGAVVSQCRHCRHQSQLGRQGSNQTVVVTVAGPFPTATHRQRHMDTTISSERERVSTGAVLSQCLHCRHQSQLGRQAAPEIVAIHPAGPPP